MDNQKKYPPGPCHNALSARVGDWIEYRERYDSEATKYSLVEEVGWQHNGGKVWSYLTNHTWVSNILVVKVDKSANNATIENAEKEKFEALKNTHIGTLRSIGTVQYFLDALDQLDVSMTLKVAIQCVVKGDIKNLRVASFLISERAGQMQEIEALSPNFIKDLMQPTNTEFSEGGKI